MPLRSRPLRFQGGNRELLGTTLSREEPGSGRLRSQSLRFQAGYPEIFVSLRSQPLRLLGGSPELLGTFLKEIYSDGSGLLRSPAG